MTADQDTSAPAYLTDYIIQFSATYVLCILVVMLVSYVLDFDAPSVMGIVILIAAMSPPIRSFVSDNQRVFEQGERARFATGVAFASLALNVGFAGAFTYVSNVLLDQRSPLIEAIEAAQQQGISMSQVLSLTALIWVSVAWVVAYLFAIFSAKSWRHKLSSSDRP